MKKIFLKLLLAALPLLIILGIYFITDPFQVLYHHDSYFPEDGVQYVSVLKDYTSTQNLINRYDKYKYDSYIFGSSRSMYYHADEWSRHLPPQASIYHYDAYGESLYGIERKLCFLQKKGVKMKNAMIVFDAESWKKTEDPAFGDMKHPAITGQSWLGFQYTCLKYFLDTDFLSQYITFLLTGKIDDDIFRHKLSDIPTHYNKITNELTFPYYEKLIEHKRDSFYNSRLFCFQKRDAIQQYFPQIIQAKQKELFYSMKQVLDENHTSYKIVLSPLYDQLKTDSTDLKFLYSVFGRENVYDFSGINDMTQSIYNYYENSHYRPFIANRVMDSVYARH